VQGRSGSVAVTLFCRMQTNATLDDDKDWGCPNCGWQKSRHFKFGFPKSRTWNRWGRGGESDSRPRKRSK
jgi:hypothetical protein